MKRTLILFAATALLTGCADTEKQEQKEKQLFNQVMLIHDELMEHEHVLMDNKQTLDSLAKTPALKDSAELLGKNLTIADDAMSDWMHHFDPDYKSKPHEEAIKYLTEQQEKIARVDSLTKTAVSASGIFISKHKK
ncbi:MAG: hypothetical protein EOP46_01785 [Sphingobacteriaceae bacterium]|nr:MAG: hypothetical protein EOP46_01785 [Sphingobacteriaceae bacterium]